LPSNPQIAKLERLEGSRWADCPLVTGERIRNIKS